MAPGVLPFKRPGGDITFKATAAVVANTFVKPSGNRTGGGAAAIGADLANVYQMATVGAAGHAVGVAKNDVASGALGVAQCAGIAAVIAGATLTFGQAVEADAAGKAIPLASGIKLGVVMTGAASAAVAEVMLTCGT